MLSVCSFSVGIWINLQCFYIYMTCSCVLRKEGGVGGITSYGGGGGGGWYYWLLKLHSKSLKLNKIFRQSILL